MTIEVKMNTAIYTNSVVSGFVRDSALVDPAKSEKLPALKIHNDIDSKTEPLDALKDPDLQEKNESEKNLLTEKDIDKAVTDLNSSIQSIQRSLKFSVDEELGRIIINVTDKKTNELVRQIPSEELLEVARNLQEMVENQSNALNKVTESGNKNTDSVLFSSSA